MGFLVGVLQPQLHWVGWLHSPARRPTAGSEGLAPCAVWLERQPRVGKFVCPLGPSTPTPVLREVWACGRPCPGTRGLTCGRKPRPLAAAKPGDRPPAAEPSLGSTACRVLQGADRARSGRTTRADTRGNQRTAARTPARGFGEWLVPRA